jgi:hypothetical protein
MRAESPAPGRRKLGGDDDVEVGGGKEKKQARTSASGMIDGRTLDTFLDVIFRNNPERREVAYNCQLFQTCRGFAPPFVEMPSYTLAKLPDKCTIRVLERVADGQRIPLPMRGIKVSDLDNVMQNCPGKTISQKRKWIAANCPKGASYIEWQIEKGALQPALAPQYFVSHSNALDGELMFEALLEVLGGDAVVWVGLLACDQRAIANGVMDEIGQLPEVIRFVGQMVMLPSALSQLSCICEAGWSITINRQLAYAGVGSTVLAKQVEKDKRAVEKLDKVELTTDDGGPEEMKHWAHVLEAKLGGVNVLASTVRQYLLLNGLGADDDEDDGADPQFRALKKIFVAGGGSQWTDEHRTNWMSDKPLGEWEGVVTNDKGEVTELSLHRRGMDGTIPAAIGDLVALESINMWGNEHFGGLLPSSIGRLVNLKKLWLHECDFQGTLPQSLSALSSLETLTLYGNSKLEGEEVERFSSHEKEKTQGFLKQLA